MNDKQTFQMCLKQGVAAHGELIAEIGELASKEYVIEQTLDKMLADWATRTMELAPYKTTGNLIKSFKGYKTKRTNDFLVYNAQISFLFRLQIH